MIEITEITNDAKQKLNFVGENGEKIVFTLDYQPFQQNWIFSLTYLDFFVSGCSLKNSANILKQYDNILPFGISCSVRDGTDPYYIDDFTTGRVKITLLTASEAEEIKDFLTA